MSGGDRLDVLLIDDDSDYFVLVRGLLETRRPGRWRVSWGSTVDQALERITQHPPAVILLDHELGPNVCGLDLVMLLRERAPEARVLYLTAFGPELGQEAVSAGAHAWIDKGQVTSGTLEAAIEALVGEQLPAKEPDRLRAFLVELVEALGNPLTLLTATLQDLRDEQPGERLDEALEQAAEAGRVLDALGAVAWPDDLKLEGLPLRALLLEARAVAERRCGAHRVIVEDPDRLRVTGHAASLVYVLTELLANAFEAAPGEPVTVTVGEENGGVAIAIADQGPGAPPLGEAAARWTSTKGPEHAGLGLHFAHLLVGAVGGRLRLEAGKRGTTARVMLEGARGALPRLLIVDDEPMMLSTLKHGLEGSYAITTAGDVDGAREALERGNFDLVLSDIVMPDGSGLDLYGWVAVHRPALAKRFVFMTGHARDSRAASLFRRAALPVVAKPFHIGEIRRVLASLLGDPPG